MNRADDITAVYKVACGPEIFPMGKQDKRVDQYIAKSADFAKPILNHIRRLVHIGVPNVEETTKWSMPFFEYKGVLCYMAAFKAHCSFGFWKTKLVLGKTKAELGKESTGAFGRIAAISDLPSEKVLIGYLKKAAQLNETGELPPSRVKPVSKEKKAHSIPGDLEAALRDAPKARQTFEGFSYSHKHEYIEWISEAKRDATRKKRLVTAIEWLSEAKSRHWKYKPQLTGRD
jgi:uncharacterized protein YdeI (YjbR/CyaY-like superfamily)